LCWSMKSKIDHLENKKNIYKRIPTLLSSRASFMGAKKVITTMIILLMAQIFEKNLFNDDSSPIVLPVMFSPVTPRGQIIYVNIIYHISQKITLHQNIQFPFKTTGNFNKCI
jgi:hypothetical protein